MPHVEKDITIDAPIERVYRKWTDYESFPSFMEHVKEVRRVGPDLTRWTAEAAGQKVEWTARTVAESNRRVAWTATGMSGQSGEVRFESEGPAKTRLRVRLDYTLPSELKETAAHVLGIDERAVMDDLKSFKEQIESEPI